LSHFRRHIGRHFDRGVRDQRGARAARASACGAVIGNLGHGVDLKGIAAAAAAAGASRGTSSLRRAAAAASRAGLIRRIAAGCAGPSAAHSAYLNLLAYVSAELIHVAGKCINDSTLAVLQTIGAACGRTGQASRDGIARTAASAAGHPLSLAALTWRHLTGTLTRRLTCLP
jgi:hypothetical protein